MPRKEYLSLSLQIYYLLTTIWITCELLYLLNLIDDIRFNTEDKGITKHKYPVSF